jgi:hypothetical protein
MGVEVVIPSLRQGAVERLVDSLFLCDPPPDIVTVVSNETRPFLPTGAASVRCRLLRFSTDEYAIGELDVALRQNVGIYSAEADIIIIQGDDQVAPPSMISDSLEVLEGKQYLWGNHRLLDFQNRSLDNIRLMDRWRGMSREMPEPPHWHGYHSCYGGMFVARTDFIRDFGAFDMAYLGRHAQEDQQLGFRLMYMEREEKVFIHEPPFSWHDVALKQGDTRAREPWLEPMRNGCGPDSHDLVQTSISGCPFLKCSRCPFYYFAGPSDSLFRDTPLIRYRHDAIQTDSVWL